MIVKKGTCFNSVNSADVESGLFTGFPEHGKKLSKGRKERRAGRKRQEGKDSKRGFGKGSWKERQQERMRYKTG